MTKVRSADAEIAYETTGRGAPVVLLHPFPADHEFWHPLAGMLTSRYQLILPDLRGHGDSEVGEGPALMAKHAADIARIMDDAEVGRAPMVGVSIGGYALFEFWRKYRGRAAALILIDTRATPDSTEAGNARLKAAAEVLENGTEAFLEGLMLKLLGETTRQTRPDLVEAARKMMRRMSPEDMSQVQRGMAARPDSIETLKTINVPALIVVGEEDTLTPVAEAELMRQHITGSQMQVLPKAGHYSPFERPEEAGRMLRQFLDSVHGA
jgi:pimeloyl-ACP methyl ester carboxylesterase